LLRAADPAGVPVAVPRPGERVTPDRPDPPDPDALGRDPWWRG